MSFHSSVGYGVRVGLRDLRARGDQTVDGPAERGAHHRLDRRPAQVLRHRDPQHRQSTARERRERRDRPPARAGRRRPTGPAITDSARAASRTVRVSGPSTDSVGQPRKPGSFGTSPKVGLCPTTPQNAAGIRIEPPPSVPRAIGVAP